MAVATTRLTITRETAASRWIAANPAPERSIPDGYETCPRCDGTGTHTTGYRDGQPLEDCCTDCLGFGCVLIPDGCPHCANVGEVPVMDVYGDLDSTSVDYCTCLAGQMLAANDEAVMEVRLERERALAGHPENEATPALTEVPF